MPGSAGDDGSYWRRHARRYDRAMWLVNRRFARMAELVAEALAGRERVLEIAAGTGLVTERLARAAQSVVATDRSSEMLEVLRGRVSAAGLKNVEIREADAMALPFPDASFDGVVAANVLHLLSEPGRMLDEALRVLRPGGVVCVPTFCHGETLATRILSHAARLSGFPIVTRFRGEMLRRLAEGRGVVVRREVFVPGLFPIRFIAGTKEI